MTAIKFDIKNAEKVNAILSDVNGKATDHTYKTFQDMVAACNFDIARAENLVGGKKFAVGIKIIVESGQSVSKSYKYTRIGTQVTLESRPSGWFITDITRADIWASGGKSTIHMTPAHHERAIKVLESGYVVVTA
jgi:hypothetical protein